MLGGGGFADDLEKGVGCALVCVISVGGCRVLGTNDARLLDVRHGFGNERQCTVRFKMISGCFFGNAMVKLWYANRLRYDIWHIPHVILLKDNQSIVNLKLICHLRAVCECMASYTQCFL